MAIKKAIEQEFGDQVHVDGFGTPEVSGKLEVEIVIGDTREMIHSKKGGDGYVETPEKMKKILDAIRAKL